MKISNRNVPATPKPQIVACVTSRPVAAVRITRCSSSWLSSIIESDQKVNRCAMKNFGLRFLSRTQCTHLQLPAGRTFRHEQAQQSKKCQQPESPEEGPCQLADDSQRQRREEASQSAHRSYQSGNGSHGLREVLRHQLEDSAISQPDCSRHPQSTNCEWDHCLQSH